MKKGAVNARRGYEQEKNVSQKKNIFSSLDRQDQIA